MKTDQPFSFRDHLARAPDLPMLFDPLLDILDQIESFAGNSEERGCLIGIKAGWGTGKTSILRAVEEYFSRGHGWPVVFFEAWKYQEEESPILPLLSRLRDLAVGPAKTRFRKTLELIGVAALATSDAMLKVATQKTLGTKVGVKEIEEAFRLAGKANAEISSRFEGTFQTLKGLAVDIAERARVETSEPWTVFAQWKKDMHPLPKAPPRQLLVIVDDLDRLLPDRAVPLLESIRFFLTLPRTIVVLGINDQILSAAIEARYRDPETKVPFFSGREFMEKLFQWSMELPSRGYEPYMDDFHFTDVKTRLGISLHPGKDSLLAGLDPLPHRKWVRIANRWETYIAQQKSLQPTPLLKSLWLAVFHECFPKAEAFLRGFPKENATFMWRLIRADVQVEGIIKEAHSIACEDETFFRFPKTNLTTLTQGWRDLVDKGVVVP
ncbi:MAG: P-loop NTPase fold protein [Thermodesulfobacteriota bacterium]